MVTAKVQKSTVSEKQIAHPVKKRLKKKSSNSKQWQTVKLKGNVITEDGGGFEGLIGLEVLEDYNPNFIQTGQGFKTQQQTDKKTKKKKKDKKSKTNNYSEFENEDDDNDDDEEENEDEIFELVPKNQSQKRRNQKDSEDEDDGESTSEVSSKKKKKLKQQKNSDDEEEQEETPSSEKLSKKEKKLAKIRESREKRKEKRKAKQLAKQKELMDKKSKETEYPPDRFALLRPPVEPESETDSDEAPELVDVKNPNSISVDDLEGWNGFGIPAPILKAIADKGFKSPTEIQNLTLPAAILGKKDILGAAETGSGKTLAFGIPILAGIMELKSRNVQSGIRRVSKAKEAKPARREDEAEEEEEAIEDAGEFEMDSDEESDAEEEDDESINRPLYAIVLTPTRELAVQVRDHLIAAAKYTGIQVAAIFGGLSVAKQERVLKKCPEIVVATPGRLWELFQQDNPHLRKIPNISFLVIDETDRMIEKGHFEELKSLLKVLNSDDMKKKSRQNFVFSATLTLVHDLPEHMQKKNYGKRPRYVKQTSAMKIQNLIDELGISQPKIVDITRQQQTAQTLTECRLICAIDQKDYYLYYFIERHPGRTIVFCNSIDCVKRLGTLFGLLGCNPLPLHANMIQKQRLKNLEKFRDNPTGLLIATDVAARGLDIPNVDHVIHYQVPRTSENYVHRSGRTARANKDGITVMFMEPGEVKNYVKLYKTLNRSEDLPLFPVSERYLNAVKERVNLAREVDKQELKLKRTQSEKGWMKKHAEELDIIIDGYNDASDDSEADEDLYVIENRKNRLHLANTRAQLKSLLATPIFPKGFSFKYPSINAALGTDKAVIDEQQNDKENSAVKAVKASIEEIKLAKKMRNKKKK